uniref:Protein TIC 214 n=1 Tax=Echinosophora koreensis TaxID=228658 RepID=A0A7T1SSJ4_9FABA|nr:Ycf1 [Echinosophora koreensis]QPO99955.1 Ycf1 [Echinosophora koreensis]WEG94122.1 Ycf1 [Echinosophora koreensis]
MILQSLILDNLVSRCMKIMNSVVVVGLYYGFLITFSIGPSYLFLLRARVIEEGTEKKASATTGFIAGQLIMFISIYYAPLHLALGRPYTVTVIVLPYLLFHFLGKNHKHFFNYGYKNPNSIRNFSIPKIFFNNLIFQLLNPFLPSSMLVRLRLATIYMFQCNNKLLFLTSSFVGWLIGHTLLMKWIGLILVWIKKNNSIQSNVPIRFNKYIMSANKYISMSKIFIVFLFITCLYYLGRTPPAFFSKKLSEILEKKEIEKKKKIDVERTSERAGTKQKQKRDTEKYLFPEKDKEKNIFGFQKTLVTILFDYKRWHRPLRYIKNDQFENGIRNEISQFFFHTCQSDGKEIIFFTYPPNLLTFIQIIEKKISLLTTEKTSYNQLANYWSFPNDKKTKKLNNEFINRAKVLDKEFIPLDIFEKRIRLCNDETKTKYLPKIYDPFLNGPCRGRIKKCFSTSIKNETYKKNDILINKIHDILLNINSNYSEFEQKIDTLNIKSLLTEISFFLNLINKISGKSVSNLNFETLYLFREQKQIKMVDFEEKKRKIEFLFDTIRTDLNGKTIVNRKKCIGIKEISKKVPRWSYKLIDELQQLEGKNPAESYGIRSRKAKRVVIFTNNSQNDDTYSDTRDADNTEKNKELALIRYSQQSDFRRDIIKGSIRAQRRKIGTWKLFLRSVHSPLFLDKIEKPSFVSFDIFEPMKIFFMLKNWMRKKTEILISNYTKKKTKESEKEEDKKKNEKEEKRRIEIGEAWDNIIFAQVIRGFLLITQSILRKYIILPSLIITKNIVRILLFQFPEWSEDFRDWKREMYIKCTYNGVQLSEREFPKNWLTDGIQIKILFPFRLKPWHRSKLQYSEKEKDPMKKKGKKKKQDFCFLTIWGMEVELPFSGYPRNRLSFFDPIFKELKKKMKKFKFFFFLVVKVLNERTKLFLNVSKDTVKWIIKRILKRILFLNEKIKKLPNSLFLFRFKKKNSTINTTNTIIYESPIPIQSINWTNYSLTQQKIKNMNAKTKTIRKQIEKMTKEKKRRGFLISEINISSNKTTYDAKKLKLQKNIWQILQRKKARLARKSYSFFKFFFMERVYIDIFICIISTPRIILQLFLFLESTKKMINKSIYNNNNEANAERNEKTNQSIIQLIKIIKKSYNIRNTNSQNELSSLSQAYVFYKLFQIHLINVYKYKLRSVFEYNRRSFFLKNEIKDYFFGVHGIFHFKLRHKNPPASVMNQWTNWLKGHSQYDLSQSTWSRLGPPKWRNRINKRHVAESKDLTKCDSDSYEKNRLMLYKKEQVNSLTKKKKMKKQYGYDLLSYKSINYVDKKDSYGYRLPFQANKKKPVICYNYNMRKQKLFDITGDISITNYIAEGYIIDMKKNLDRKYFDRMKMDVEIQNRSTISTLLNPEFLLFSKLVIFDNAYTNNPWIVPIKLLFINFNVNKNVSENKNISGKKKIIDIFRPSKKKSLELELEIRNQAKAEYAGQVDLESSLSNQEKDIEEDSAGSDRTNDKGIKKKKYKNKIEEELNFLLRKYLSFQLNWKGSLNQRIMNNITIYCLLIRLINLKQIAIASIQRGELSLDIMAIQNQKALTLTEFGKNKNKELMKKGILIIESVRLSRKNDEQFIMYQTIGLSLIHKNKRQIKPQYPEKTRVDKKTFDKSIIRTKDQKITENQEKNHSDLPVPENILSSRRRRELRILICFTPRNRNSVYRKTTFSNENKNKVNNCCQVLAKNKDFDRKKKKNLINLKLFLWPIYRLEDLSCMNRYWFDTNNGSRFSIVRIHIYPQLKIR